MLLKLTFLLGALGSVASVALLPEIYNADSASRVAGEYLIVLKPAAEGVNQEQYVNRFVDKVLEYTDSTDIQQFIFNKLIIISLNNPNEYLVRTLYSLLPEIVVIEANIINEAFKKSCIEQETRETEWGLSRIAKCHNESLNYSEDDYFYTEDNAGRHTTAYVIDSGINTNHTDFSGRAFHGFTCAQVQLLEGDDDLHGHGTHVAGILIGTEYGVAKEADAISVKAMNGSGNGTTSCVVAAVNWIYHDFKAKKETMGNKAMAVVNMSLGGMNSISLDKSVEELCALDLPVVVAAGNYDEDACNYSPGHVSCVITVGATDKHDRLTSFSNYGKCVAILAPGTAIKSAFKGSDRATELLSGTSMAAPMVSGVIARMHSHFGYCLPLANMTTLVMSSAAQGIIDLRGMNATSNRFLCAPCEF